MEKALIRMMKFCAYRDRCHKEVKDKLIEIEVYGEDLDELMCILIAEKFLDEERYARSFARGKFRIKKWGRWKIKQELKRKQISEYCIKKAMEELDEFDYEGQLRALLVKKAAVLRETDQFKRKGKLAKFAQGKGFESELIWTILKDGTID